MKWKETIGNLYKNNNGNTRYDIEKINYLALTSTNRTAVFIKRISKQIQQKITNFIIKTFIFINITNAYNLLTNVTFASILLTPNIDPTTSPTKATTNAPTCSLRTDPRHASTKPTVASTYKLSMVPSDASQSDTPIHTHIIAFTVPPAISVPLTPTLTLTIASVCSLSVAANISPTLTRSIAPTNLPWNDTFWDKDILCHNKALSWMSKCMPSNNESNDKYKICINELVLCGEYLNGKCIKFNSNSRYINSHYILASIQAFSHWTYNYSKGKYIMCDIQGVRNKNEYKITDPCICSITKGKYGATDIGMKGIISFFYNHKCNEFCEKNWIKPMVIDKKYVMKKRKGTAYQWEI